MKLGFSKPVTFVKIMPLFSDISSLPSLFVQNTYLAIIGGVYFSGYWFSLFSTTKNLTPISAIYSGPWIFGFLMRHFLWGQCGVIKIPSVNSWVCNSTWSSYYTQFFHYSVMPFTFSFGLSHSQLKDIAGNYFRVVYQEKYSASVPSEIIGAKHLQADHVGKSWQGLGFTFFRALMPDISSLLSFTRKLFWVL